MQCVILAGGLGTRLSSAMPDVPKALAPVAGRPFADHQLAWLSDQGVDHVVYCIGHLGDAIRSHVSVHHPAGMTVDFVEDGEPLLGTGGALRRALDAGVLTETFFVLYGDTLLDVDLHDVWRVHDGAQRPASMTVFDNADGLDRSNASFDGDTVVYDKHSPTPDMTWIDYGLSVIERHVVEAIPSGVVTDLADVFTSLSEQHLLTGFRAVERFWEIGTPDALAALDSHLRVRSLPAPGDENT